jgi:DNA-binding MarR family transcriptional regulator
MKSNLDDYLKYWRVIRQFAKIKYNLTQSDLDMLLFLYSEKYFSRDKFQEFDTLLGWDVMRFQRLVKEEWIIRFRNRVGKRKALYKLTHKAESMIQSLYRKLSGEEIPTSSVGNKLFQKNVSYTDKAYRDMIIKMNAVIKQQRHQIRE